MWEMVEYASIRLMLVWAMAARFPSAMDNTASITSICCQSMARLSNEPTSKRIAMANAASLGAVPINNVIAVGAP